MAGERKIVGMWPREDAQDTQDQPIGEGAAQAPVPDDDPAEIAEDPVETVETVEFEGLGNGWEAAEWDHDEDLAPKSPGRPRSAILLGLLALGWTGFYAWTAYQAGFNIADPAAWSAALVAVSIPLSLLAAIYLILQRSSHAESNRYASMMHDMDTRTAALQDRLASVNQELSQAHAQMREDADRLGTLGMDVADKITLASQRLSEDMGKAASASDIVSASSQTAFAQVEGLIAGLPKVDAVAARLTENLKQAGLTAHQHGSALQAQMASLQDVGTASGEALAEQARLLEDRIAALKTGSEALGENLDGNREAVVSAITETMDRMQQAVEEAREQARSQVEKLVGEAESARDRLVAAGNSMADSTRERLAECDDVVVAMGDRLEVQAEQSEAMVKSLSEGIGATGELLGALDEKWAATITAMAEAVGALRGRSDEMRTSLADSEIVAQALLTRSENLMVALDSVTRDVDETLPRALERLDRNITGSKSLLDEVTPAIETIEAVSLSALGSMKEAQELLTSHGEEAERQRQALFDLGKANINALSDLRSLIADIQTGSHEIADSAAPKLVEAMVRVRETAGQAISHARTALDATIVEASDKLREATASGMVEAVDTGIEDRISEITGVAQRAVDATRAATEQLMQQMIVISETSSSIETRVADARSAANEADEESLSRHVSLLTESLKSTAIDVTKILSNEVTDTAWAAYLKGDRGVFTRRAVRLLDATEAKEILSFYENDSDFREYVNRYIHDFEAMLRTLLGSRNGQSLSVTLLSSDMGKLYVALAQAIERLRS